jgi:hypothetical protein
MVSKTPGVKIAYWIGGMPVLQLASGGPCMLRLAAEEKVQELYAAGDFETAGQLEYAMHELWRSKRSNENRSVARFGQHNE